MRRRFRWRSDTARIAARDLTARISNRPDWFQGREIAEALFVRMLVIDGRPVEAFTRFTSAVALAESSDVYNAAWLTLVCAEALVGFDRDGVRSSILRYSDRVRKLGYAEMTRRYEALAQR